MEELEPSVGMRLRRAREEKQYTLKQLSEYTGLSIGFISQVERGQTDPSLASLKKLATGLGIKLRDLFDVEATEHIVIKKGTGSMLHLDAAVTCELLAAPLDKIMEPMIKYIAPGGKSGLVQPHSGEEFIWVMKGTLKVTLGPNKYILTDGDSVYFQAEQTHSWENVGKTECQAMWVMTPPSYS